MSTPLIHDYIGLSEASSSVERSSDKISSSSPSTGDEKNGVVNFTETELRLGLPGSQSPERKGGDGVSPFLEENKTTNGYYPFSPLKNFVSGAKRGFSDTIDGSGKWVLSLNGGSDQADLGKKGLEKKSTEVKEVVPPSLMKSVQEKKTQVSASNQHSTAPAAKAQVVGWPPIRSYRKNIMATNSTKNVDDDGKAGSGCLYVKVSMDGAPYLRKVDLKTYSNYIELSSALEKMFSCFTIGQCSSQGLPGRDGLSENRIMDHLHGSEYVLTYEDSECDWMLVGDVPWEIFTSSCKRLRIMKGSEAIGLAPRAMEKCKNRN